MKQAKNIFRLFDNVVSDAQMLPSHISMYVSLIQLWSVHNFKNPFRIHREEVMKLSRIKSLATYHRCIKQLDSVRLINYLPSYDPYKGSLIEIIEDREEASLQINKSSEKEFHFAIPELFMVELYFRERDFSSSEANKFYSYYQLRQWKLSNNKSMTSWQAAARNWIQNTNNEKKKKTKNYLNSNSHHQ